MRRLPVCLLALAAGAVIAATPAPTGDTVVSMTLVDTKGQGAAIGEIVLSESPHGLVLTPRLKGLPPGLHGFHVHERPSCAPAEKDGAMVAGQVPQERTTTRRDRVTTGCRGETVILVICPRSMLRPTGRPPTPCSRRVSPARMSRVAA